MLGRFVSDLAVGDVLGPMDYELTPFMIREHARSVEDSSERWHASSGAVALPTIVHGDKKRLLEHSCPEGAGPVARLHLDYDATHHRPIPAGAVLQVDGEVVDRFEHKGRERLKIVFEVRDRRTGVVYTTYRDTSLLSYEAKS